jgi:hypothetical protein
VLCAEPAALVSQVLPTVLDHEPNADGGHLAVLALVLLDYGELYRQHMAQRERTM